jgi:hypothetical protein
MHANVRCLLLLLVAGLAAGAPPAAAAPPPKRVPLFHLHLHRADCLRIDPGLGGSTCGDLRSTERDVFVFRDGAALSVTTTSRSVVALPGSESEATVVRLGTATPAQLQAVRAAAAPVALEIGKCNPFPNGAPGVKHVAAHYELNWYERLRLLDLSTGFTRPCPPQLMALIDELVRLGSRLPVR